jgi:hypothetical protein
MIDKDLSKVQIYEHQRGLWVVWIPPTGPESYDVDGWSYVGPFGDTYFDSWWEAVEWVFRLPAKMREESNARRRRDT